MVYQTKHEVAEKRELRRSKEDGIGQIGQTKYIDSKSLVTPEMRWLSTQSRKEEERFLVQMKRMGQENIIKRPSSLHRPTSPHEKINQ